MTIKSINEKAKFLNFSADISIPKIWPGSERKLEILQIFRH